VCESGLVWVTWDTDVSSKYEASIVSTKRVLEKDKFPSPSRKPKDGVHAKRFCSGSTEK
jgi:hypothetical protein